MHKAISGCGTAGVRPLNPEMFTEIGFEPAQQANGVILQITENIQKE
jgi:hypothetical protein